MGEGKAANCKEYGGRNARWRQPSGKCLGLGEGHPLDSREATGSGSLPAKVTILLAGTLR